VAVPASLFRCEGAAARQPREADAPAPEVTRRRPVPPLGGGVRVRPASPRPLRTQERARASEIETVQVELPSYEEPTVDALAPDADEGRGWLR
jgi:hypothetical protein